MTILRDQKQIADASTADLVETYNAMTGKTIKKFSSRAAGERQVAMALLAATDAAAHAGVKPGEKPAPKTAAELGDKIDHSASSAGIAKALAAQPTPSPAAESPAAGHGDPSATPSEDVNPFPPGSMAHGLWIAGNKKPPIQKIPRRAKSAEGAARVAIEFVKATFAGISKPQAGSVRNSVLLFIQSKKDAAGQPLPVAVRDIDDHIQTPSRGYIQKLLALEHLVVVEAQMALGEGESK